MMTSINFCKLIKNEKLKIIQQGCRNEIEDKNSSFVNEKVDVMSKISSFNLLVKFNEPNYRIAGPYKTMFYINEILSSECESNLLDTINDTFADNWTQLRTRFVKLLDNKFDFPSWLNLLIDKLHIHQYFNEQVDINHVLINKYKPHEGIMWHVDGPKYTPRVVILSLGSYCKMSFRKRMTSNEIQEDSSKDLFYIILHQRSLLIFEEDIYELYMHGINADTDDLIHINDDIPCLNLKEANLSYGMKVSFYFAFDSHMLYNFVCRFQRVSEFP